MTHRDPTSDDPPPSGAWSATSSLRNGADAPGADALAAWMPTERVSAWPWGQCALAVGETLADEEDGGGKYRIVRLIGRGGMGEVYEAERAGTGERFALKCMRMGRADDPKIVRRTQQEAIVLRSLRHAHLVPVYAMGLRSDGLVWMLMELLVGWTAGQLLDGLGKLPVPWALTIARDVCLGLQAVHPFAVHRDIKPDNIHIDEQGHVRVLDLGAGKFKRLGVITTGGFSIGTVAYMSPEQIMMPDAVDARSDLFSTGIVLYELLSGQHPFAADGDVVHKNKIGLAIAHDTPRPLLSVAPWVPAAVGEIVAQALEKDPADRQDNAEQLAIALDAALRRMEHEMGELPPLRTIGMRVPLPAACRPQEGAGGEAATRGRGETEPLPAARGRGHTEPMPSLPPARTESAPPRGRGYTEPMPSLASIAADQGVGEDQAAKAPAGGQGTGGRRAGDRAWRPPPPAVRHVSKAPRLDTEDLAAELQARHAETAPIQRLVLAAGDAAGAETVGSTSEQPRSAGRLRQFLEAPPRWFGVLLAVWILGWLGSSAYVYLRGRPDAAASDEPAGETRGSTTPGGVNSTPAPGPTTPATEDTIAAPASATAAAESPAATARAAATEDAIATPTTAVATAESPAATARAGATPRAAAGGASSLPPRRRAPVRQLPEEIY
ncbi:serine/threonine protein kinase [Sorangium sp. So ce124]|uniref:serine/threonine protein kinase n=1 Tax=Sorangium sp. So ce124 TaxID=3133280 RepID=UPI003F5E1F86